MAEQTAPSPLWRGLLLALTPLALLFAALMCAGFVLAPPPLRAANATGQFNAAEAQARLTRVLGDETPHPVDSVAGDVVRAALLREIAALGYQPTVREHFACRAQPRGPLIDCAMVRNIIFSLGPQSGPAVLAATHYDSVPAAPGASDAGIGIAVWLEVARLMRDEQVRRRVIVLISDGEEPALLGAHAFATSDPLMSSVEAVVNLEARGTRGPAVFFESNQPNADAVAAFAHAPRPIANSVMADVYAMLQNSTDVTALKRPGLDVVNIALLDGLEDYHTPQDSLASFNPRSLQHMGDIALATTRAFAHASDPGEATPLVYTDIASYALVSMPSWAGQMVLALCAAIAFVVFWRGGATQRWRTFAVPPLALALAGLLATAVAFVLGVVRPGQDYWFAHPEPTRAWCALLALLAIVLALAPLHAGKALQASAAGAFWFAAVGFTAALALPGMSILFALPAAFFAAGALVAFAWRPALAVGAALSALVATLVWSPTLHLVELALGFDFPFAIAALMTVLGLTWLGAFVRAQADVSWRGPAIALSVAATACIVAAALVPAYTSARPRALNITHFFNAGSGEALVLAGAARRALPSALADGFAFAPQTILPGDQQETWAAHADAEAVPTPALAEITSAREGEAHVVRARLRMNGAYRAVLRMPRAQAPEWATVNGVETRFADTGGADADYLNLACQGRACDGAELALALAATPAPQDWYMVGQYPGSTTASSRTVIARRPASATPIQFGDGALTLSPVAP